MPAVVCRRLQRQTGQLGYAPNRRKPCYRGVTIIRADKGHDGDYAIALELRLGCADRQA
jgi:hypothetical protein